jgi:uncharacterized protein YebE (UPF0316 family)
MNVFLNISLYFGVGFLEMFLATQRTYWISKGRSFAAALLVFFENFIALFVIYQIANNLYGHWPIFIAYAVGNSLGTYINLQGNKFFRPLLRLFGIKNGLIEAKKAAAEEKIGLLG